ncbi:MAG: hypothetical protein IJY25_04305 [Bacilli bacterium]|nr:hypothetical protein [Bacilli bacterium]
MSEDLKIIKDKYGEKMMHLCRSLFSTLLEHSGLLSELLLENFYPSRFLYEDIIKSNNVENFKNCIYSLYDVEQKQKVQFNKTPKELLSEVGYDLFECKTEEDIQKFKKYYYPGEELCTFKGRRLNSDYVFFAIKKNVNEIKRDNFKIPRREDDYGISVLSIQFSKGDINTLSIKNRYNHKVNNPDATFSNNLENIIPGLTSSFEREYNLNINQNSFGKFELPGYVNANDGKYYKYNYEINNIYYCPSNIIIDRFEVKQLETEKYIVLDYFILDLVNKKIKLYDTRMNIGVSDDFVNTIRNIEKISIIKGIETKTIEIITSTKNKIIIELDKTNKIIKYKNNEITEVRDNFLGYNECLEYIEMQNLRKVGNCFLANNKKMSSLDLSSLVEAGDGFLINNGCLKFFSSPKIEKVGDNFLFSNLDLEHLELLNLKELGDNFLFFNIHLKILKVHKLIKIGRGFLYSNENLDCLEINSLDQLDEVCKSILKQCFPIIEINKDYQKVLKKV